MAVRLLAFTCGWLTGPAEAFLAGETGRLRVPVPCFLVDHPRALVLFDSGLHPELRLDFAGRLGVLAKFFEMEFAPGEDVASRLTALEVDPDAVRFLVNSHLHFDHTGGNGSIPNAELVVQRREWEAGQDADLRARNSYNLLDYDLGHRLRLVDGEHDLFGDGRVVCLPTYGHTPGHQSLRVRHDGGEVILTSDACYLRRTLEEMHLPGVVHDEAAMLESLRRIRALRDAGARVVYGHDPEDWATVRQAPLTLG